MKKTETVYLSSFGDTMRKFRLSQRISQKQLGFETNLSRETINRIEHGKINVSLLNVYKIALALNVHPKDLLSF